jgi:hypothetical protein
VVGSCENGNETSGSIGYYEILEQLNDCFEFVTWKISLDTFMFAGVRVGRRSPWNTSIFQFLPFFFPMALQPFLGPWPHISVSRSFYTATGLKPNCSQINNLILYI